MRWKEIAPQTVIATTSDSTRNRCRNAACTMRWIMHTAPQLRSRIAGQVALDYDSSFLKRVRELQEQAAISRYFVSGYDPVRDLHLVPGRFSQLYLPSSKLIASSQHVHERLVLRVPQHRRVRDHQRVGNFAGEHSRDHIHVLLQAVVGILDLNPGLQRTCGCVQCRGDIGNLSVEFLVRVRIGRDRYRIPDPYIRKVLLVNIGEYPDGTRVGNRECLRRARLDDLPGSDQSLHNLAPDWSQ